MIDPLTEETFPISEVPERIKHHRRGRTVHRSTVFRWINPGVRGVRLETVRVGGMLATSSSALRRFLAALNRRPASTPPEHRRRRQEQVEQQLKAMGM